MVSSQVVERSGSPDGAPPPAARNPGLLFPDFPRVSLRSPGVHPGYDSHHRTRVMPVSAAPRDNHCAKPISTPSSAVCTRLKAAVMLIF